MSKIPHGSKNQDGCQSAIFDQVAKQIVMDKYLNMYNIRTKFEQKLTSMSKIPHIFKKQDGYQSAIFDHIAKQIVMDMYPNMYIVCTKFEQKLTKHVLDTTHFQKSRWLPVSHL